MTLFSGPASHQHSMSRPISLFTGMSRPFLVLTDRIQLHCAKQTTFLMQYNLIIQPDRHKDLQNDHNLNTQNIKYFVVQILSNFSQLTRPLSYAWTYISIVCTTYLRFQFLFDFVPFYVNQQGLDRSLLQSPTDHCVQCYKLNPTRKETLKLLYYFHYALCNEVLVTSDNSNLQKLTIVKG